MSLFDEFLSSDTCDDVAPAPDMCSCGNCGWEGKAEGLEVELEQDGYEAEPYQVHLCPACEDGGCIDNYWYSEGDQ